MWKKRYLDIVLPEALPHDLTLQLKQWQLLNLNVKMCFPLCTVKILSFWFVIIFQAYQNI